MHREVGSMEEKDNEKRGSSMYNIPEIEQRTFNRLKMVGYATPDMKLLVTI